MSKRSNRKQRREANRHTGDPSGRERRTRAEAPTPRPVVSLLRTLLCVVGACALVLAWQVVRTSGPVSRYYEMDRWDTSRGRLSDRGEGVSLQVGRQPTIFRHATSPPASGYPTFRARIYLEQAAPVQLVFFYRDARRAGAQPVGFNLSPQVRGTGWHRVEVTTDEARGLAEATEIGLQAVSMGAAVGLTVRDARLVKPSWFGRTFQVARALFTPQPLGQGSNNFNMGPTLGGRGYGYVLWAALALVGLALLVRRFMLREPFAIVPHLGIAVLALAMCADLRNHADYLANARAAFAKRSGAEDLSGYLGAHERFYPWFGDAMRYLLQETAPDVSFAPMIDKDPPGTWQAIHRLWYYVLPRKRVWSPGEADVAIYYGEPVQSVEKDARWRRVKRLPSGATVYERVETP